MALPRWVENQYRAAILNPANPNGAGNIIANMVAVRPDILRNARSELNKEGIPLWMLVCCRYKRRYRQCYVQRIDFPDQKERLSRSDEIEKVYAFLYVGISEDGRAQMRPVTVCRYFQERLNTLNKDREEEDRKMIALREKVLSFKSKIFKSRCFPAHLRHFIFYRDGFKCQMCGKHKDELVRIGLHLEVDHKIAWEDGGDTTYENGETLCNKCNIAKHLAKKLLRAQQALW